MRPINVATEDTASHPAWSEFLKWAHEAKPRISDLLVALAIFLHLAGQLGLGWAVYTFGDDCSMFFNQFRTRTEHWPFTTFLMDDGEGNPLFVLEKGMTFGPSKASQLAQRIANFIIDMFCRRMDEVDAPFVEEEAKNNPALKAWLLARGVMVEGTWQWTTQCRLFAALMYTDDPCFLCLGAERCPEGA